MYEPKFLNMKQLHGVEETHPKDELPPQYNLSKEIEKRSPYTSEVRKEDVPDDSYLKEAERHGIYNRASSEKAKPHTDTTNDPRTLSGLKRFFARLAGGKPRPSEAAAARS